MLEFSIHNGRGISNAAYDGLLPMRGRSFSSFALAALCLLQAGAVSPASAHELEENRATIIKREDRHILMTLYLDLPKTLSAVLEPKRPFKEFVLLYASLPASEFAKKMGEAETYIQAGVHLQDADGGAPLASQWRFPDADRLQNDFRLIAAQIVTSHDGSHHDEPVMMQAEFLMAKPVQNVRVNFPELLQPVLIVAYAPKQIWSRHATSVEVSF